MSGILCSVFERSCEMADANAEVMRKRLIGLKERFEDLAFEHQGICVLLQVVPAEVREGPGEEAFIRPPLSRRRTAEDAEAGRKQGTGAIELNFEHPWERLRGIWSTAVEPWGDWVSFPRARLAAHLVLYDAPAIPSAVIDLAKDCGRLLPKLPRRAQRLLRVEGIDILEAKVDPGQRWLLALFPIAWRQRNGSELQGKRGIMRRGKHPRWLPFGEVEIRNTKQVVEICERDHELAARIEYPPRDYFGVLNRGLCQASAEAIECLIEHLDTAEMPDVGTPDSMAGLPRSRARAWSQYCEALKRRPELEGSTDRQIWEYLRTLPEYCDEVHKRFETWQTYVSEARRAIKAGAGKAPKAGSGRSIIPTTAK
jgi:hypothetical protein